jgi:hypothetical protein
MFYAKIILISTVNWIITNALVLIVMMSTTGREVPTIPLIMNDDITI